MMLNIRNFLATHQPKNGRFFTIAIDGRGGSGKTSFAELLKAKLPDFVMLNGDDYFEPIKDPTVWGEFNDERFIQDVIEPLKRGNSFVYRPYDWHATPNITEKNIEVTRGICLERCYSFGFSLDWDLRIWVETPKDVCLERGLARENMPKEKTIPAWQLWQAREDAYIQKYQPQEKADIVIDGMEPFKEQL
jgi:uridine kinase